VLFLFEKANIRDAVAATYKLEEIWKQHDAYSFAIWRFIGLEEGIYRKYPATKLASEYDPTRRPWQVLLLMLPCFSQLRTVY
jgi:hypothetical protein